MPKAKAKDEAAPLDRDALVKIQVQLPGGAMSDPVTVRLSSFAGALVPGKQTVQNVVSHAMGGMRSLGKSVSVVD